MQIEFTKGRLLAMKKEFQQHVKTDGTGTSTTDFDSLTKIEKDFMPPITKSGLWFLGGSVSEGKDTQEVLTLYLTTHSTRMGGRRKRSSGMGIVFCCVLFCFVVLLTHTNTHTHTHTHTHTEDELE